VTRVQQTTSTVIAVSLLFVMGCRQPDGEVPVPTGEQPNKIYDIGRDLQNVAVNAPGAVDDLNADLVNLSSTPPPDEQVKNLSNALASAFRGKTLSDADAQRVSRVLFLAVTAQDFNSRQVEKLQSEVRDAVAAAGADPESATKVATLASSIAREAGEAHRRWYHVF
jgi:hypothetical protein